MSCKSMAHFSPGRALISSFFITISLGTIALCLPWARNTHIPFIDIFFTATSATCVAGLKTISLDQFTFFGQCILLLLIQMGGLGLITLSIFLMSLFMTPGLGSQIIAGRLLELNSWQHLKRILFFTIILTLAVETLGATIIYWAIKDMFNWPHSLFVALFHAISSFCNAGISITGDSMELFYGNNIMIIMTMILVFIGGLGFITWYEIIRYTQSLFCKKRYHFSLHSKIILIGSSFLLITSALIMWLLEYNNVFASQSIPNSALYTLFQAIAFRSSGFTIFPISSFTLPTLLLIMIICFIGSSPGSTGSGIKVTTFFIYLATIRTAILGKSTIVIKGRTIPLDQVLKVIAIISLSVAWILLTTFILLVTQSGWNFFPLFFESVSAFSTLGMSMGVTPTLTHLGKTFIIISMIIGRVGSLTLIVALRQATIRARHEAVGVTYPEERVMLS